MYAHDKRHACGSLMPNFFFLLQITAIAILSYIFMSIAPVFHLSSLSAYGMGLLIAIAVFVCLEKRQTVLRRQKFC